MGFSSERNYGTYFLNFLKTYSAKITYPFDESLVLMEKKKNKRRMVESYLEVYLPCKAPGKLFSKLRDRRK